MHFRNQEPRLATDKREGLRDQRFHPQRAVESKSRIAFSKPPGQSGYPDITFRMTRLCSGRGVKRLENTTSLLKITATTLASRRNIARIPVLATGSGSIISTRRAVVFLCPATAPNDVAVAPGDKTVTDTWNGLSSACNASPKRST